jgi:hypothetical protein
MPNEPSVNLGVVKFMPQESFEDPAHGLSPEGREMQRESMRDRILAMLDDEEPPKPLGNPVGDWPKVREAICRNGMFVIETSTPAFTAMLRFCPMKPDEGDYEIHYQPHGGIEKGRTLEVKAVTKEHSEELAALLTRFAVGYIVYTTANDRARTQKVWLVGLSSFRNVDATDVTDDTGD